MLSFSVILTAYNRPKRLERAIETVLNQTYQNFELLLMDDNSDDPDHIAVLNKYKDDPRVHLYISDVKDEERGEKTRYSVLINQALKVAKGDLIAYICDDDRYALDRLERFATFFESRPDVYVAGGDQLCMTEEAGIEREMPTPIRKQTRVLENPNCCVDHTSVVHRREVLEKVPGWSEDRSSWDQADGQFFEALGKAGYPMHPLGGHPTDTHIYHDGSWTKGQQWRKLGYRENKEVENIN